MSGPYSAAHGAVHHEASAGFLFTVSPPSAAKAVADALNKAERVEQPMTSRERAQLVAETIERCAKAAEATEREGWEWVRESLWANILKRAGANVRALAVRVGEAA